MDSSHPSIYYYNPYYYGSYYYSPYCYGYYYNCHGLYVDDYSGHYTANNQQYVEGSITLMFIDTKANKVIWRGTAEGDIYNASNISKDFHPAVHSIIDEYPVEPLVKRIYKI